MKRPLLPLLACAIALAACGGDSKYGSTTTAKPPQPAAAAPKPGPTIDAVIAVARQNPGYAGCKEIDPGQIQKKIAATDPETVQALLCDHQIVSLYWVWGSDAEATAKTMREDRPSFVNGKIVVTTGEALLAKQYDNVKSKTLPDEIKAACGCGAVVTP